MTREEIHKLPWKAQEYINKLERKLTLTHDVMSDSKQLKDKQIEEILSKYEKTDDKGFAFISTEIDQDNLVNDLNALFSIHSVVVPKGTLVCKDDNKSICNNPMSHECCNKHHKRI
jgi:hypothetical protein